MTREEAHTLLEIMAINLTGAIANSEDSVTEQTKLMAKQIEAIDMAIEALHQKGAYEQTKWERDVALQTLEEHGIGLGQKVEYIIPSGDVMFTSEVVRCKDCKWYMLTDHNETEVCTNKQWDISMAIYPIISADGFCSYGERREK